MDARGLTEGSEGVVATWGAGSCSAVFCAKQLDSRREQQKVGSKMRTAIPSINVLHDNKVVYMVCFYFAMFPAGFSRVSTVPVGEAMRTASHK